MLQTAYPSPQSPDTVLATNMISVGVDVDRLGLMVVSGQPQTTSEYIRATSRVGRRHPGLVVTLFNSGRSQDLSHYEAFTTYHRSIYQQVEATGATPFAPRAPGPRPARTADDPDSSSRSGGCRGFRGRCPRRVAQGVGGREGGNLGSSPRGPPRQ
ncbi:helicase-related protein [Nocardioides sp. B-3]|uniref:helicase-related protein n=1 Tax=Nocardioides sp. B-3 TaxID=2895565 RepID=UPI002152670F|nr:helicase-related protein [Nocardioides sp. B-3]UUZ59601.1 hypothetical protein LP418_28215 [Nocardioides sp. B-3]